MSAPSASMALVTGGELPSADQVRLWKDKWESALINTWAPALGVKPKVVKQALEFSPSAQWIELDPRTGNPRPSLAVEEIAANDAADEKLLHGLLGLISSMPAMDPGRLEATMLNLARNPAASSRTLDVLAGLANPEVRQAVAGHMNTSLATLDALAQDPDSSVAITAQEARKLRATIDEPEPKRAVRLFSAFSRRSTSPQDTTAARFAR